MQINHTILRGNCGDATPEQINRYAYLCTVALESAFPAAEINVRVAPGEGAGPATTVEFDDDFDGDRTHDELVASDIPQIVWEKGEFWND
ncbi:MAG: hypothetical protein WBD27_19625 [Pyrinomonadaceae bacterium]